MQMKAGDWRSLMTISLGGVRRGFSVVAVSSLFRLGGFYKSVHVSCNLVCHGRLSAAACNSPLWR